MSITALEWGLIVLGLAMVFPYLVYPFLVPLFTQRRISKNDAWSTLPKVSILIPAHNEGQVIHAKMMNTLALNYPKECLEILVCSDGSSDMTWNIVKLFEPQGVTCLNNDRRMGKAATINRLIDTATGDFVLFTDASAMLDAEALNKLVDLMRDPNVGVSGARYVVTSDAKAISSTSTEVGYWSMESRVRQSEAARDMLLGASGAGYLVRRELVEAIPTDTINDDYIIPLSIRAQGYKVCFAANAIASETPTDALTTSYRRWVRIGYGNYQMLWRYARYINPLRPRLFLPLLRKLLRTLGPVLLTGFIVLATMGSPSSKFAMICALGAWTGLICALLLLINSESKLAQHRAGRVARYMFVAQSAYFVAFFKAISNDSQRIWRRSDSQEALELNRPATLPIRVQIVKRFIDIIASSIGLLLTAPIMIIVAIWIRLDSPGAVIYCQERLRPSRDGSPVPFKMYKFRSMRSDAEAKSGPVWAQSNDTRVTRVGRLIRKYRIDELPQLVNVLIGQMSLVGPRPERSFFAATLQEKIPGYNDRLVVLKPGITGLAQVTLDYDSSIESVKNKTTYDLAYLAQLYTLGTYLHIELRIMWKTVFVMIKGQGAR